MTHASDAAAAAWLSPEVLRAVYDRGAGYDEYVSEGSPQEVEHWRAFYERVRLTESQRAMLGGFTRRMHVLVVSGTWCPDCSQQLPILRHAELAQPEWLRVRYVDRDAEMAFAERVRICGGTRVPTVIVMNEDFDLLALAGDRTLSRYRSMAAARLAAACPVPGAPIAADEVASVTGEWLGELERCQLMCLLSTKLRSRHGV